MKLKLVLLLAVLTAGFTNSQAQFFKNLENQVGVPSNATGGFSQDEAGRAIKEALTKGITHGVDLVSVTDGYFKNPSIKIPFPSEAQQVESALRTAGMGSQVDQAVESFNHAAENAAKAATAIFINAIKQMTLNDAISLVNNKQQDAATQFLKRTTTDQLVAAFKPSIKDALDKVNATKYWSDIMGTYNRIPFHSQVNTDLPDYVTRKAIDGLFYMVAQEEAKIRKDPMAQTSDLLKKVFGNAKM
jgi:hypothetical protein